MLLGSGGEQPLFEPGNCDVIKSPGAGQGHLFLVGELMVANCTLCEGWLQAKRLALAGVLLFTFGRNRTENELHPPPLQLRRHIGLCLSRRRCSFDRVNTLIARSGRVNILAR